MLFPLIEQIFLLVLFYRVAFVTVIILSEVVAEVICSLLVIVSMR